MAYPKITILAADAFFEPKAITFKRHEYGYYQAFKDGEVISQAATLREVVHDLIVKLPI